MKKKNSDWLKNNQRKPLISKFEHRKIRNDSHFRQKKVNRW